MRNCESDNSQTNLSAHTFRENCSTMSKNMRFPANFVTEIKSEELFGDSDEPVRAKISAE